MAHDVNYDDVTFKAVRDEAAGIVEIVAMFGGAEFPIAGIKIGDVDERLTRAAEERVSQQQQSGQPAQPQP